MLMYIKVYMRLWDSQNDENIRNNIILIYHLV